MSEGKGDRFVFVCCPACKGVFQVERSYWEPRYTQVPFTCTLCKRMFPKEEAAKIVGL